MKTGRGWTWGTPKTGRFTHNPPHRPKNTAFPAQSLVYTEEFSMGRDKRGMENRKSTELCGHQPWKNSGAILLVHYTRPGLLCVGLFTLSVVTTFSCRHFFSVVDRAGFEPATSRIFGLLACKPGVLRPSHQGLVYQAELPAHISPKRHGHERLTLR